MRVPLPPSRPLHSRQLPDEPLPTGIRQFTTGAGERQLINWPLPAGPFSNEPLPEQPPFNGPLPERQFLNRALPEGLPNEPLFNRPVPEGPFSNGPLFEGPFFNGPLFEGQLSNGIDPLPNGPLPDVAPSTNPATEDHTTPQRFSMTHTVSLIPLPLSAVVHQSSQTSCSTTRTHKELSYFIIEATFLSINLSTLFPLATSSLSGVPSHLFPTDTFIASLTSLQTKTHFHTFQTASATVTLAAAA